MVRPSPSPAAGANGSDDDRLHRKGWRVTTAVGVVMALLALLVAGAWLYDRFSVWWAIRDLDRFAVGDVFTLVQGRRALVDGVELRMAAAADGPARISCSTGWQPQELALGDLPAVVGSDNLTRYEVQFG